MNKKKRIENFFGGIGLGAPMMFFMQSMTLHFYPVPSFWMFLGTLSLCVPIAIWIYRVYPIKVPQDELEFRIEFEVARKMKTLLYGFAFMVIVALEALIYLYPEVEQALKVERFIFLLGILFVQVYEQLLKRSTMRKFVPEP